MMKRVILIDPYTRTVTKVEAEDGVAEWKKLLQCEEIEALSFPYFATMLLVDQNAKLTRPKETPKFLIRLRFNDRYGTEIIGKAIVVSHTLRGKTAHVKPDVKEVSERVKWITTEQN